MSGEQYLDVDIRAWSDEDLPLLMRVLGDPEMTVHLGGPESPEQIRSRHQRYLQLHPADKGEMLAIVVEPEGIAAGSVGYWERDWRGGRVWETGWSVLPEFQGRGVATQATLAVLEKARAAGTHRYVHAFPKVDNAPSNAICRKAGFTFLEAVDFEYPPGHPIRCNDWRFDLFADQTP